MTDFNRASTLEGAGYGGYIVLKLVDLLMWIMGTRRILGLKDSLTLFVSFDHDNLRQMRVRY